MGTFQSFRKAYGALKDSTKVGLAKVNSEYKELDIAIVKATNHVEYPPKERHVRTWDCSAWVRTYALFLEERLECFRVLKYDIESERLTKASPVVNNVRSKTRSLDSDDLLEQLPALQQLLYRLIGCQPEGCAYSNHLVQYALALAENLADFYEYCKGLDLTRNFQFPTLRQEYQENEESSKEESESNESAEPQANEEQVEEVNEEESVEEEEEQPKEEEVEPPPLISTDDGTNDLLGLNEINPKAMELEESNAMALAIVPPGGNNPNNLALSNFDGTTGWELSLVTTPSNHSSQAPDRRLAGGFDKLLLDSLYEDENARRQLQLQNAGYGHSGTMDIQNNNPFDHYNQQDPFAMSNNIAPPPSVQMALMSQQQQQQQMMFQQQQMMYQQAQQQHNNMMMVPYHQQQPYNQYPQQMYNSSSHNPFGDPLPVPNYNHSSMPQQGNYNLM
ncbi:hypothetical protein JHK82_042534 [Glycine max]|nr:hypothetical protein JHK85_043195 [Glycine max]KAG5105564.1 hypothetical protein JHK82_042534 [Glycine max]